MSEYQQDPSASTGRFQAFYERGEEEAPRARRRSSLSPAVIIAGVVIIAAIVLIIALA
jgi:hypothetical protein